MKKLAASILALMIALAALAGTGAAESGAAEHTITGSDFPLFQNTYDTELVIPLKFVDGATDLPYIEVNDLLNMLILFFEEDYTVRQEGSCVTFLRENLYPMTIDFEKKMIRFTDYDLFVRKKDAATLLDMVSVNTTDESGKPFFLQKQNAYSFDRYGDEVTLPLGDYGIELYAQDGLFLVPLQTINDFILAPQGKSVYFNGQCVLISKLVTPEDDFYYSAPVSMRSEALAKYGYGELCLMMDCMFGTKELHEIDSFDRLLRQTGLDRYLKSTDPVEADLAVWHMITDYLDDNHTAWHSFSYMAGRIDQSVPRGASDRRYIENDRLFGETRAAFYPDGVPGYEEVGNTAYITFDDFVLGSQDTAYYYSVEDPANFDDSDTVGLIIKAHSMITREGSPVENVVLDLSKNQGGASDAAIFVMAWFLGEASVSVKNTFTGATSTSVYRADVNRDRIFDERDTLADRNLFCLISPVSFSCGNLVPCVFKESAKVTLLGRTSGGGSCGVMNVSTAWGTSFQISGKNRLSFLKNGSVYDIDRGADPDFVLLNPSQYYDRQSLTTYINSLVW